MGKHIVHPAPTDPDARQEYYKQIGSAIGAMHHVPAGSVMFRQEDGSEITIKVHRDGGCEVWAFSRENFFRFPGRLSGHELTMNAGGRYEDLIVHLDTYGDPVPGCKESYMTIDLATIVDHVTCTEV